MHFSCLIISNLSIVLQRSLYFTATINGGDRLQTKIGKGLDKMILLTLCIFWKDGLYLHEIKLLKYINMAYLEPIILIQIWKPIRRDCQIFSQDIPGYVIGLYNPYSQNTVIQLKVFFTGKRFCLYLTQRGCSKDRRQLFKLLSRPGNSTYMGFGNSPSAVTELLPSCQSIICYHAILLHRKPGVLSDPNKFEKKYAQRRFNLAIIACN